jgi:hypothetical protein
MMHTKDQEASACRRVQMMYTKRAHDIQIQALIRIHKYTHTLRQKDTLHACTKSTNTSDTKAHTPSIQTHQVNTPSIQKHQDTPCSMRSMRSMHVHK